MGPFHLSARIQSAVPPLLGWRSYPRALGNLLLFGLVTIAGEWLVHQIGYLIQYGDRFSAVMGGTPHRFYMGPAGMAILLLAAFLMAEAALSLCLGRQERSRLLPHLPDRIARRLTVTLPRVSLLSVARTWLALAFCQMLLYMMQENLESAALGQGLPGAWALLSPQHAIIVPLHLLAAAWGAIILWTFCAWLERSRRATRIVRLLSTVLRVRPTTPPRLTPYRGRLPNLRLAAGTLCLRSPPIGA